MRSLGTFFSVALLGLVMTCAARAADAPGKSDKAGEWTGAFGCASCNYKEATKADKCTAAFKVDKTVYLLKASDKADDAAKKLLEGCKKDSGDFTVKGTIKEADGKQWILVDAIKKAEKK